MLFNAIDGEGFMNQKLWKVCKIVSKWLFRLLMTVPYFSVGVCFIFLFYDTENVRYLVPAICFL